MNELAVIPRIAEPVECNSWDELAAEVRQRFVSIAEDGKRVFLGAVKTGAMLMVFAERPEVKAAMEAANKKRRGRPWTPHGFVAAELVKKFGRDVPTEKHLSACGRAAVEACQKGILRGNYRKLLAWDGNCSARADQFDVVPIPRLSGFDGIGDCKTVSAPKPFIKSYVAGLGRVRKIVQKIIGSKPRGFRISSEEQDKIDVAVEDVNVELAFLGYRLTEKGKGA